MANLATSWPDIARLAILLAFFGFVFWLSDRKGRD
jgi:hypothetical protein